MGKQRPPIPAPKRDRIRFVRSHNSEFQIDYHPAGERIAANALGESLWQRNYYDHIIRSAEEWDRISRYIIANPINWAEDSERLESTVK